jgi:hypothetical protein
MPNSSGSSPSAEWSVIATFSWLPEALLLKSRLESSGIAAQIPESFSASIHPAVTAMQVRVLVPTSRLADARELLELEADVGTNGLDARAEVCSGCGGTEFRREGGVAARVVLFLLGFLASVPMRAPAGKRRVCARCGRRAGQ